ncbi:MAG: tyrosine-type recombinase/integrase [Tannerella sp.]|nr:tyrosine-type recombinase/integrase [Tannerella sp.]
MKFKSIYAAQIEQYIAFKRALGFAIKNNEYVFIQFDRLACDRKEISIGISKELSDAWCDKHPNETEGTRYDRISKLSLFSRYLCNKGYLSYIPEIPKYKSSFVPYIFTKEEISLFFAACDRFKPNKISVESFHYIIPTFFRLLYGTGLRLGEALTLLDKDVNVEEKCLIVRNSKNGTDRIVPMSDSLSNICMQYRAIREAQNTGQSSNLFFRKNNNTACCPASIYAVFRELLRMAGIPYNGKVHGPRTHDLRHTFVCHSLASMAETGMDIYHSLPILATYIGHRTIESTEKYARLTAEMYPGLLKNIEDSCSFIFPAITSNGSV